MVKVCAWNDDLGCQTKNMCQRYCAAGKFEWDSHSLDEGAKGYHKPGL